MLSVMLTEGISAMQNVNILLVIALKETEKIKRGETFLLKDLFKGYVWRRIPLADRLLLGTLFLNHIATNETGIKAIEKTSARQQQYEKAV